MSPPHSPLEVSTQSAHQEFDLGLQVPAGLNLQQLFPHDRLLRLHPHWFISDFKEEGTSFSAAITDYVTENQSSLAGSLSFHSSKDELLRISMSGTVDATLIFLKEEDTLKARIIPKDGLIEDNDPILLWLRGVREYIRLYLKRTPVTLFFRLIMNRMILQMNPSQRKICMMITKITAVELLVIVLIVVGYVFFVL